MLSIQEKDRNDQTLYKQVILKQKDASRVCWLPAEGLKAGIVCKLKGDEESGWWRVESISKIQIARYLLHTDWTPTAAYRSSS